MEQDNVCHVSNAAYYIPSCLSVFSAKQYFFGKKNIRHQNGLSDRISLFPHKEKGVTFSRNPRYSGSSTWARTRDLRINSPSLYRLSYRGIEKKIIFNSFDAVKLFLICHFLNGVLTASSRFLNYSVFLIVVGIFAAFQLCFRDRCCFLCLIRIFQKLNEDFPFPDHGQFAACTFLDGFRAFAQ